MYRRERVCYIKYRIKINRTTLHARVCVHASQFELACVGMLVLYRLSGGAAAGASHSRNKDSAWYFLSSLVPSIQGLKMQVEIETLKAVVKIGAILLPHYSNYPNYLITPLL
jgi:hypothetical protein